MTRSILTAASVAAFAIHGAFAQSFEGVLDPSASTATVEGAAEVATEGFLIGDYDPDTNPGGTQTRPGLFGGSGNNPIPASADFIINADVQSQPSGTMGIGLSTNAGTIELDGLAIDLLGGTPAGTNLTVRLLFQTFNTINPSFIYPGGTPFEIDAGEVGTIVRAELVQAAPSQGVLTPTADPDTFDFSLVMAGELNLTVRVELPDSGPVDNDIDALPAVLPISGRAELLGDGSVRLTIQAETVSEPTTVPIDSGPLPPIPVELPTLGTATAGVLLNLTPQSLGVDATVSVDLVVLGQPAGCVADWNGDGQVNFFDIVAYLDAFNTQDPAADLAEPSGVFNFFDIVAYLDLYNQGCP